MNAYQVLGIGSDADERTIKRAYAALIKQYRPDTHPAEFAQVRAAYEAVLHWLRENQQWQEQQQAEENKAGPVASVEEKPGIQTVEPATAVEDAIEQPAAVERNLIVEQLNQLEEIAMHGNEQAILAKYREQSARMAMETLDQQLEYEQALLYWVLATQHPSLLLFAEANKRYDWVSDSIAICRRYGDYAGYRLAAMDRLATLYSNILKEQNPFLSGSGSDPAMNKKRIVLQQANLAANEMLGIWKKECSQAGLEQLNTRFTLIPPKPSQIYTVDVILGGIMAIYGWLSVGGGVSVLAWAEAIVLGLLFTILPSAWRVSAHWLWQRIGHYELVSEFNEHAIVRILVIGIAMLVFGTFWPSVVGYGFGMIIVYYASRWLYDSLSRIEAGLLRSGKKAYTKVHMIFSAKQSKSADRLARKSIKQQLALIWQNRSNWPAHWIVVAVVVLLSIIRRIVS